MSYPRLHRTRSNANYSDLFQNVQSSLRLMLGASTMSAVYNLLAGLLILN